MNDELRSLYQQVILDHSRNPRHFSEREDAQIIQTCFNPLCGDEIKVYCDFDEEKKVFKSLTFTGNGCAISVASASLMVMMMQNHDKDYFQKAFNTMTVLLGQELGPKEQEVGQLESPRDLAKLEVLAGVKNYPSRVKCATCAWHTLASVVKGGSETIKTE